MAGRRSNYGAGYGRAASRLRGTKKRASVDNTRHTGGSMGLKARNAGKRIGQK